MSALKLALLGEFSARDGAGKEIAVSAKKSRALLAILALSPSGAATRERLANLLWSDRGDEQARSSLRQALAVLKKELSGIDAAVLSADGDRIGLDGSLVSSDVAELQRLARTESLDELRRAASLYRGDLLADTVIRDSAFEDWLSAERRRLADTAIAIFERLAAKEAGRPRIAAAQRLVALDPLKESAHRALMEAHALAGEKAQALQHYAACRDLLQTELDVKPSSETEELRSQILGGTLRAQTASASDSPLRVVAGPITIAVLPFTNMSGDAAQEYFVDGLTEDLITALAKFRFFSVLSRNATFQFKGGAVDIPVVGRQLGARYVLEGSVRSGGNRIRVTAQLIDAESGAHVWAERFDRELADVFAVQDEIVAAIVGQLTGRVIDAAVDAGLGTPSRALTAYDHYIRSSSAWRRGAAEETLTHLLRAVDAKPDFAPALGFLGFFYAEDIWMQVTGKPIAELEKLALEFANRANVADTGDADVQLEIGTTFLDLGDLDRAQHHLELSLALNPHETSAAINLGMTMVFMGAHREGLARMEKALSLDHRMAPAMQAVPFICHCIMGDAEAAKRYMAANRNPFAWMHLVMAACFAQAGREEEARNQLAEFNAKRTAWFDTLGVARWMAKCLRMSEDKVRVLEGFRKLGLDV